MSGDDPPVAADERQKRDRFRRGHCDIAARAVVEFAVLAALAEMRAVRNPAFEDRLGRFSDTISDAAPSSRQGDVPSLQWSQDHVSDGDWLAASPLDVGAFVDGFAFKELGGLNDTEGVGAAATA